MINLIENSENLTEIYSDMKIQFPVEELKPVNYFKEMSANPNYKIFSAYKDNKKVGYLFCYIEKYILIDYIAVYKEFQSCGYGSEILKTLFKQYYYLKGCIFEVEKINYQELNTQKRQKFYKKLGCENTNIEYYYPSFNIALPMDLFYYPLSCSFDKSAVINFIKHYFKVLHFNVNNLDKIVEKIH